jgi:spore coat protein U-like protein
MPTAQVETTTMKATHVNGRALRLAVALVLAAAGGAFGVNSHAGTDTATLPVSAQINATCTISTVPLAFGNYDPIVDNKTAPLTGTGFVSTICTIGSAVTITLGQGANPAGGSTDTVPLRQMASGANRLAYFLYSESTRITVWGNTVLTGKTDTGTGAASQLTIYAAVTGGQNKPVGSYTDTVVATVTY